MQPSDIQPISAKRNGHHSDAPEVPNAADMQASQSSGRGPGSENTTDPVIRHRCQNGSTQTRRFAYDEPLGDGERLRNTPLSGLLEELSRTSPHAASLIEWYYDHILMSERDQLLLLRAEEDAKRQAVAERARAHNVELEARQERIRQAVETELDAVRAERRIVDSLIHGAHLAAAVPAALVGGAYDPVHPETACLHHSPQPLGVVMGRSGLPWVEGDGQVHLPGWLIWIITVLVGAMIGVSIGLLAHCLHPDSLDRTPGMTLTFVAVGFAVAVGFKYACRYAWFVVGQYAYSQLRQWRWLTAILTAILITGMFVVADAMTNLQGLLAMASQDAGINDLSGVTPTSTSVPLAMYLVSLVVSAGFIACSSYEGYLRGRHYEVHNRALALQYDEFTPRDSQVRADPKVINALARANEARVLAHRKACLEARASQQESARAQAIHELDSRRLPVSDDLSEKATLRIQDQRDNVQGAMRVWNHLLSCAFPCFFRRRRCHW